MASHKRPSGSNHSSGFCMHRIFYSFNKAFDWHQCLDKCWQQGLVLYRSIANLQFTIAWLWLYLWTV